VGDRPTLGAGVAAKCEGPLLGRVPRFTRVRGLWNLHQPARFHVVNIPVDGNIAGDQRVVANADDVFDHAPGVVQEGQPIHIISLGRTGTLAGIAPTGNRSKAIFMEYGVLLGRKWSLGRQWIQPTGDAAPFGIAVGGRGHVQQRVAPAHFEQPDLAGKSLGILPGLVVVVLLRQGHLALFQIHRHHHGDMPVTPFGIGPVGVIIPFPYRFKFSKADRMKG
jgi:hypothetical protein